MPSSPITRPNGLRHIQRDQVYSLHADPIQTQSLMPKKPHNENSMDGEQFAQLLRGDRDDCIAHVLDKFGDSVYRMVYPSLRNREDARDVTQNVITGVWRSRKRYDPSKGSPKTWIMAIARNKAIDKLDRRTRDQKKESLCAREDVQEPLSDLVVDFGQALEWALDQLIPEQSDLLRLYWHRDKSIKKAAEILGIPYTTALNRYHRGFQKLSALVKQFDDSGDSSAQETGRSKPHCPKGQSSDDSHESTSSEEAPS